MGSSPGRDWALWLAQTRPGSLQGDHEQACTAQERQRAATTACFADHATALILGQKVDLDLGFPPLVRDLRPPPLHTLLLMIRPMHVR